MYDLLCGLGPHHIKLLCDNVFLGGFGYRLEDVGKMSLDQIFFMFTQSSKTTRKREIDIESAAALAGPDGLVRGRAADGTPFKARWAGLSLAARIRAGKAKAAAGPPGEGG